MTGPCAVPVEPHVVSQGLYPFNPDPQNTYKTQPNKGGPAPLSKANYVDYNNNIVCTKITWHTNTYVHLLLQTNTEGLVTRFAGVTGPDQIHQTKDNLDIYTDTVTGTSCVIDCNDNYSDNNNYTIIDTAGLPIEHTAGTQALLAMGKKIKRTAEKGAKALSTKTSKTQADQSSGNIKFNYAYDILKTLISYYIAGSKFMDDHDYFDPNDTVREDSSNPDMIFLESLLTQLLAKI